MTEPWWLISTTRNIYPACSIGRAPCHSVCWAAVHLADCTHKHTHTYTYSNKMRLSPPFTVCLKLRADIFFFSSLVLQIHGWLIPQERSCWFVVSMNSLFVYPNVCWASSMLSGGRTVTVEKITSRWVFVWDQKLSTGLLSDQGVKKNKTEAIELGLIERTVCLPW